jgi:elongation factor P hydroxylase
VGAIVANALKRTNEFDALRLERVFRDCFFTDYCTRLCGGAVEPLYQPAQEVGQCHVLWYREDFFASALHEVAHWCIAGEERRRQVDFGYWYAPDGRDAAQQAAFEAAEDKPQALEWFFSLACGYRFQLSIDNLDAAHGVLPDDSPFRHRVCAQAIRWQRKGLPGRAERFYRALCAEFGTTQSSTNLSFRPGSLL